MNLVIYRDKEKFHYPHPNGHRTLCGLAIDGQWEEYGKFCPFYVMTVEIQNPDPALICKTCTKAIRP